jgi:hypothetical protein
MAVSPVIPHISAKISEVAHVTKENLPLSNLLAPGETLTVSVLERLSPNQYRVSLKNVFLTATCDLPLNIGEKIQVKVQSIQPQIIFSIRDAQKQSPDMKINEGLIHWRMNPDSFTQLLSKVNDFLQMLKSGDLPLNASAKEIDSLVRLFKDVVFSTQTKMNPMFVKDFINKLGLLMENDLSKMSLQSARGGDVPLLMDNLKASLLKLSAELSEALRNSSKFDAEVTAKLMNLASFTSEALRTIEAKQAVNIIYQQNESGLYLQIPLAAGNSLRQADIFITPDDKNASSPRKYSFCSIMIFLDLDYLGELSIEASVREGHVRCVIKCECEEITQLVAASAGQLKEALSRIGYGVEQIDCLNASALERKRAEYIEQQLLGSVDLVNYFV